MPDEARMRALQDTFSSLSSKRSTSPTSDRSESLLNQYFAWRGSRSYGLQSRRVKSYRVNHKGDNEKALQQICCKAFSFINLPPRLLSEAFWDYFFGGSEEGFSTAPPAASQAVSPPSRALALLKPACSSKNAARALVCSLGQVQ